MKDMIECIEDVTAFNHTTMLAAARQNCLHDVTEIKHMTCGGKYMTQLHVLEFQTHGMRWQVHDRITSRCDSTHIVGMWWQVYDRMQERGLQPTATTYTALVSAYCKSDNLEAAMEVNLCLHTCTFARLSLRVCRLLAKPSTFNQHAAHACKVESRVYSICLSTLQA